MNELKFLEVMGSIDEELVKEAAIPSDTVSESSSDENTVSELTASGVEIYRSFGWHRFAAIASAVLIIGGLSAAGGYCYMKNRGGAHTDNNIIEPVAVATTTESSSGDTSGISDNSISVADKEDKPAVTTAVTEKNGGKTSGTASAVLDGEEPGDTGTYAAAGRRTTTAGITAKHGTTLRQTTASPVKSTGPAVKPPADGIMTVDILLRLAENGESLTWKDFEPYRHDDIGSGQDVWRIFVYKNNTDKDYDFTLIVSGVPEKLPNITLVRGTYTGSSSQDRVDVRRGDVYDFIYPEIGLSTVLGNLKSCHPDFIRSIELTYPWYQYPAKLSHSEIQEILPMIQELAFTKNEGSKWQTLSTNTLHITITDNQGKVHELGTQPPYFLAYGTAYSASEEKLRTLTERCVSIINEHQPSAPIDINGVWLWHGGSSEIADMRDISESIRIRQFPDLVFMWNGMGHCVEGYNSAGRKIAGIPSQFNAYFADINGDGYPELCTSYDLGLNRDIFIEVQVWDIHNEKCYRLSGGEEYDYWLYEEDGELFVNRQSDATDIFSLHGNKGRLAINGSGVEFVPV